MRCFECGKRLPAMPDYLQAGGVKMRCNECAARWQANRPIVPLEMVKPDGKQISLSRGRFRRKGPTDEQIDAALGLPRAA